jgi:hypothetical protein
MHNTNDKMKRSELQEMIRAAIAEAINEADISPQEKTAKDAEMRAIDAKIKALQAKKGDLASGREEITEDNIDEMANVAVRYELAPDAAAADFAGKKSRIVAAMQATEEPMSKIDVAGALGYDKQNPINADFMALVADGVIIPSGEQRAPRLSRPAAEPGVEAGAEDTGIEGGIDRDLSDEEVDAMFAKVMKGDEEEPEAGEIEKADVSASSMSDEDYEAFMQYTDLEGRLAKVKSDILKTKRSKGTAGDIADKPSNELENLRALKDRLQTKMDSLLASSEYLQKRQSKITGKPIPKPEPEPEPEEETEPLDEWVKGRMQYYAGIKK